MPTENLFSTWLSAWEASATAVAETAAAITAAAAKDDTIAFFIFFPLAEATFIDCCIATFSYGAPHNLANEKFLAAR
ncbi:hypothetical protein [Mesorhizobium sp. WSM2240]|uniref:Uncharacterized protein n=2 Tax=unclassified Mesorhizobium TaxID=325217 RepID=A0AAU8D845_9HYPH